MEKIRALARDGFMALPRVGMGVGGLLLGTRQDGVIRVVDSIEIPCSHAGGPSFNLTDEEKELVGELIAGAGEPGVVGWYCSKTRGTTTLGDSEMAIYGELFSKPGQISLVLRPSAAEPMLAAFFFRDEKGDVVKGIECHVDEWRPAEAEFEPAAEENVIVKGEATAQITAPIAEIEPAPEAEDPVVAPADVEKTIPIAANPEPSPLPRNMPPVLPAKALPVQASAVQPMAGPDMFAFTGNAQRRKKRLAWVVGAAAMLAVGAAAFLTQDYWIPRPPLALSSTESNGNLVIRWNVDALRGIDRASMFVNDGGNLQSLPLDRFQLNQGVLIYSPKSERVTAKLSAGETSAIAVWLAPAPAAPTAAIPAPVADVPQAAAPAQGTAKPSGSAARQLQRPVQHSDQ